MINSNIEQGVNQGSRPIDVETVRGRVEGRVYQLDGEQAAEMDFRTPQGKLWLEITTRPDRPLYIEYLAPSPLPAEATVRLEDDLPNLLPDRFVVKTEGGKLTVSPNLGERVGSPVIEKEIDSDGKVKLSLSRVDAGRLQAINSAVGFPVFSSEQKEGESEQRRGQQLVVDTKPVREQLLKTAEKYLERTQKRKAA